MSLSCRLPFFIFSAFLWLAAPALHAQRQMEFLGRGVMVLRTSSTQTYIGWRLLGNDPTGVAFNLYRSANGATAVKVNSSPLTATTDYVDTPANLSTTAYTYSVRPVVGGIEVTDTWANPAVPSYTLPLNAPVRQYFPVPMQPTPDDAAAGVSYDVKFCWVGDFDGDGEYDFVVDRTNPNIEAKQWLQAYKRDGTLLWQMDMGPNSVNHYNITPGSSSIGIGHGDNVTVYDLDGDGKAEVVVRTANGVVFANGTTLATASNETQYISIIDGLTGAEKARSTINLPAGWPTQTHVNGQMGVLYCDGLRPSLFFHPSNRNADQSFNKCVMTWDYRNAALNQRWIWLESGHTAEGHQVRFADVDNDGKDEFVDIGNIVKSDGSGQINENVLTEVIHGDRFHVTDIDPERPGMETYLIQQNNGTGLATAYHSADKSAVIKKLYASDIIDVGRGTVGAFVPNLTGLQMFSTFGGTYDAKGNQIYTGAPFPPETIWWDGDLGREFLSTIGSSATSPGIDKFNTTDASTSRILSLYSDTNAPKSPYNNYIAYGGRPQFWGDILGDWREELLCAATDNSELRIYTTKTADAAKSYGGAPFRIYTLMHNPQYRIQATTKGYVQSSYVDYYLGYGMPPPPPSPMISATLAWSGGAGASTWDAGTTAAWKNTATSAASAFTQADSVRFDLSGSNAAAVNLVGTLQPAAVSVYAPQDFTFSGAGTLTGTMPLAKAGKGTLLISGSHAFTGATTVWDGALRVDGALTGSPVTVWGGTWGGGAAKGLTGGRLSGTGSVSQPVILDYRGALTPGAGMNAAGTLTLGAGLTARTGSVLAFDLSTDPTGTTLANDRIAITGNLTLAGTVSLVLNPLSGQFAPGTYTLATYTGTLTGSVANLSVVAPDGTPYSVAVGAGALTFTVQPTRPANIITWTGASSGTWDIATTQNWKLGATADVFVSGDTVTLDDTGSARPSVTLNRPAPVAGVVVSGSTNYSISGTGYLSGSGGLAKSGTGTLTLNTTNTFTGPVTITGGAIAVPALGDAGEPGCLGASPAAAANLTLNGGTLRIATAQTNTNRSLTLGASGGTLDLTSASSSLQISGALVGSGTLTKTGAGTLLLASASTYTGGTVINGGKIYLAGGSPNSGGLGSGTVTINNGTLAMADVQASETAAWNIIVPSGATARLDADGRCSLTGSLTGAGTFTYYSPYVRSDLKGNWSAFTGRINAINGDFRIANSFGYANAALDLASTAYAYTTLTSSTTLAIGALSGSGSLAGIGTSGKTVTWQVGAKNTDSTYAGVISNGTGSSALTKVGSGTLTLSGANTYTSATTVTAGKLLLAGGSLSGSTVTVQSGAGFGGPGSVTGNVTFAAGSTLLSSATGPLAITGNLAFGGAVAVAPAPGATLAAGSYPLYTYTGTLTGTPVFSWSVPGLAATFNTSVSGQVVMTLTPSILPPTALVALPGDAQAALSWSASPSTVASYTVRRSTTAGGPYADVATGLTTLAYLDTGLTNSRTYYYVVAAIAAGGDEAVSNPASVSVGGAAPLSRWRLDETAGSLATDSSGAGRHGTLVNFPAWTAGRINNGLTLASASSQHVTLPSGVVSSLNDFTLSLWVRPTTAANWTRLVDLGTGTTNYLFLTPQNGTSGTLRFAIRTTAVAEQVINGTAALPVGVWSHVAVTLTGTTGTLYLNGVAVGTNSAMTLNPASLGVTTLNYFGRSQFSADPYFNGALDEVLIHGRALTAAEVAALAAPPAAPTGVNASADVARITLGWTTLADATGYTIQRATTAGGPYAPIATNVPGPTFLDTGLTTGTPYYYSITALKGLAEGPRSAEVSATPRSLLQDWRLAHFGTIDPAAAPDADDLADPDADGLPNLLEYALGGAPLSPASAPHPVVDTTAGFLRFTFARIADPALVYSVEANDDLVSAWTPIWTSTGALNTPGPVTVTDPEPLSAHPRRYLRLRVAR